MDMKGEYVIPAPRDHVWAALNDIDVLKAAIPGCQSINRISDTEIEATVTAKVGPVKANFSGLVTLSDIDPPNGYTIRGEGKGGAAGFAKGGAKVYLADDPGGTRLSYDVDAAVGGKLAQVGGRLISSAAKKLADEFFSKFSEIASNAASEADDSTQQASQEPTGESGSAVTTQDSDSSTSPGKAPINWFLIAAALIIVLLAGIYLVNRG